MPDKNKIPPDKYMCAIKNTMKNMYHREVNEDTIIIINDAVFRTSKIVFHTYNFLKLYFMHLYENNLIFPLIDVQFISIIMMVISKRIDNRGAKPKKDTLSAKRQVERKSQRLFLSYPKNNYKIKKIL